ncbi:MAG: D-alanyl-D-alanine carboxypeptidase, partial [Candidatus Kerfeldbacteria bacterium]|nr:D-alanyl-D-alanine carboxypeptidase [Candidatus Kerfeldbacteria bacterium]
AAGEQLTVKDLLYASLVGSANNATLMLARSTGLSRAEFVARMNAKAKSLGLKNAFFVEPTGLDPGNVASAEDLAVMARVIPNNGTIRKVSSTGSYTFKSSNNICNATYRRTDGSCWHSLSTTNKLFGKTSFSIVSAKTGYIDEARHTFVIRGRDSRGHELVVVLLKTYTKADSFNGANALMNWTFKHAIWP